MANERPAGNKAGKLWIIIGLFIAVFGIGMTVMTNMMNEKKMAVKPLYQRKKTSFPRVIHLNVNNNKRMNITR